MGRTYRTRAQKLCRQQSADATLLSSPRAHQQRTPRDFIGSLSADADNVALARALNSQGFDNANRLQPALFRSTGRGVFSTRTVHANDVLIDLPFGALITLATLQQDAEFCALLQPGAQKFTNKLSIQTLLALYVLHREHRSAGADVYVRTIPAEFTQPFFCSKAELMVLPEALFQRVHEQNEEVRKTMALLTEALADACCTCCNAAFLPGIFTAARFKWAYFAVNSRSVFVDPAVMKRFNDTTTTPNLSAMLRDKPNTALAPFLDLLNHSDRIDAQQPEITGSTPATMRYALRTQHTRRPYEQLFISYGPLDNARLLLEYGFVLRANRHDCVRITLEDVTAYLERGVPRRERRPINSNRFKFVNENALDAEMFVSRADGLSHSFVVVLTVLFVETVAHFSNVLSVVGFGRVLPVEPVAEWARKIMLWKRSEFGELAEALRALPESERSASGKIVMEYAEESVRLIDDVLAVHLAVE